MEMADMFTYDKTYYYLHLQSSLSTNSRRASCTWRGGGADLSSVLLHSAVPVEEASILVYEEVLFDFQWRFLHHFLSLFGCSVKIVRACLLFKV